MSELFKAERRVVGTGGSAAAGGIRDFTSKAIQANTSPNMFKEAFAGFNELIAELKKNNDAELLAQEFNNFSTELFKEVTTFEPGGDPETLRQRYLSKIEATTESMPANVARAFRSRAMNDLRTQWGGLLASEFEASEKRIFQENKMATELLAGDVVQAHLEVVKQEYTEQTPSPFGDNLTAAQGEFEEKIADFRDHVASVANSSSAYNHPLFAEQQLANLTSGFAFNRVIGLLDERSPVMRAELVSQLKGFNYGSLPEEVQAMAGLPLKVRQNFAEKVSAMAQSMDTIHARYRDLSKASLSVNIARLEWQRTEAERTQDYAAVDRANRDMRLAIGKFQSAYPEMDISKLLQKSFYNLSETKAKDRVNETQIAIATGNVESRVNAALISQTPGAVSVESISADGVATVRFQDNRIEEVELPKDQKAAWRGVDQIEKSGLSSKDRLAKMNALAASLKQGAQAGEAEDRQRTISARVETQQGFLSTLFASIDPGDPMVQSPEYLAAQRSFKLGLNARTGSEATTHFDDAVRYLSKAESAANSRRKQGLNHSLVNRGWGSTKEQLRDWDSVEGINPDVVNNLAATLAKGQTLLPEQQKTMQKLNRLISMGLVSPSLERSMELALSSLNTRIQDDEQKEAAGSMLRGFHSMIELLAPDSLQDNLIRKLPAHLQDRLLKLDMVMRIPGYTNIQAVDAYRASFDPDNQVSVDKPTDWDENFQDQFHSLADVRIFGQNWKELPVVLQSSAMRIGNRIRTDMPQFANDPEMIARKAWMILQNENGYAISRGGKRLELGENPVEGLSRHAVEAYYPWAADKLNNMMFDQIKKEVDLGVWDANNPQTAAQKIRGQALVPLTVKNLELGQNVFLEPFNVRMIEGKLQPEGYIAVAYNQSGDTEWLYRDVPDPDGTPYKEPLMINHRELYKSIDADARKQMEEAHKAGRETQRLLALSRTGNLRGSVDPLLPLDSPNQ